MLRGVKLIYPPDVDILIDSKFVLDNIQSSNLRLILWLRLTSNTFIAHIISRIFLPNPLERRHDMVIGNTNIQVFYLSIQVENQANTSVLLLVSNTDISLSPLVFLPLVHL